MKFVLPPPFRFIYSLKFAVFVLLSIAASLASATVIESLYDTRTAQYWIYQSRWFAFLLSLLGLNILAVALSRLPWKKRHLPFLSAHLGILLMLFGSWITRQYGIDGQMALDEGERGSAIELESAHLYFSEGDLFDSFEIPWQPPTEKFKPISFEKYGVRIERFLSHAEMQNQFLPANGKTDSGAAPAIHFRLQGGPLGKTGRELWLWAGDPNWSFTDLGPAQFQIITSRKVEIPMGTGKALIQFEPTREGVRYSQRGKDGKKTEGFLKEKQIAGAIVQTPWMGLQVKFQEYIPQAINRMEYVPSRVQYGMQAPSSAIQLVQGDTKIWLGMGERGMLRMGDRKIAVAYMPKRIVLPFALQLERFQIDNNPGTMSPASFSSRVRVLDSDAEAKEVLISMNEPLHWKGFTFYQSSYIPAAPRPTVSIFSVNQDPGRWWKYIGSILIVLGSIALFAYKLILKKRSSLQGGQSH